MSFMPTFGKFLRKVAPSGPSDFEYEPCAKSEPASFSGVVTNPSEGVVDTALASSLRAHGLKISWDCTKKASACGVGGKAKVSGLARAPIGLAGVSGLIELTGIADEVPLLLPIKLLKQLRAVVDLDRNVLEIRSFNVEAPIVRVAIRTCCCIYHRLCT